MNSLLGQHQLIINDSYNQGFFLYIVLVDALVVLEHLALVEEPHMTVILQLCASVLLSPLEFEHTDLSVLVYLHFLLLVLTSMSDGDDHLFDLRWLDVL